MIDFDEINQNLNTDDNMKTVLEYYQVPRTGNRYACPFHSDRHPSAAIYRGHLHCFVCNKMYTIQNITKQMGEKHPLKAALEICGMDINEFKDDRYVQSSTKEKRHNIHKLCRALGLKNAPVCSIGPNGQNKYVTISVNGDMVTEYLSEEITVRDPIFDMFDSEQEMMEFLYHKYLEKRENMEKNLSMVRQIYLFLVEYQKETKMKGIKDIPAYRQIGICMKKQIQDFDNLARTVFEPQS